MSDRFPIKVMSSQGEINITAVRIANTTNIPGFDTIADVATGKLYTVATQRIPKKPYERKQKRRRAS